jgi:sugar O-acyltransferase (sialic acid O-acetyltransferase NeuD family)
MYDIYVIGAGGHGVVVSEIASLAGYRVVGFIDDDPSLRGRRILQWEVLGALDAIPDGATVALGIGSNQVRERLLKEAEMHSWKLPVLIHPSAVVSPSANIGDGTVVMALSAVNARTSTGKVCILNTSCSVDHDCVLGTSVHICPGVSLAGGIRIGDRSIIGIGSCVRQLIEVGEDCTIGAGSVVVSDIPQKTTAFGNPARIK